jgi:hypothetical protein
MSIIDDAIASMTHAQAEILRLRADEAGRQRVINTYRAELDRQIVVIADLLAALEAAQTPIIQAFEHYQAEGNIAAASGVWVTLRYTRAAIARAKGETFTTGQARNGVAP